MPSDEVIIPLPAPVPPLTEVRSALLTSSLLSVRERGHETRYLTLLDPRYHDALLYNPAGLWVPLAIAEAHYDACDRLQLPAADILSMGNAFGVASARSVFGIVTKLAREGGVTPWTLMNHLPAVWSRIYRGSAIGMTKQGPKEGCFEVAGTPLARFAYWRIALRGICGSVLGPLCRVCHVRELPAYTSATRVGYRVSWA